MVIKYYTQNIYGVERHYPAEDKVAKALGTLTKKKTISAEDMSALQTLGFELERVMEEKEPAHATEPVEAREQSTSGHTHIPVAA